MLLCPGVALVPLNHLSSSTIFWSPGPRSSGRGSGAPVVLIIRSSCFFQAVLACLTERHVGSVCKASCSCKWRGLHHPQPSGFFKAAYDVPQMAACGHFVCHSRWTLQSSNVLASGRGFRSPNSLLLQSCACMPPIIIHLQAGGSCTHLLLKLKLRMLASNKSMWALCVRMFQTGRIVQSLSACKWGVLRPSNLSLLLCLFASQGSM